MFNPLEYQIPFFVHLIMNNLLSSIINIDNKGHAKGISKVFIITIVITYYYYYYIQLSLNVIFLLILLKCPLTIAIIYCPAIV